MKNKRYFQEALGNANEKFYNMDADFEFSNENINATGPAVTPSTGAAPTSQPYIILVQNTTGSDIFGVNILGAFTNLVGTTAPAYGNNAGIVITYGLANISYTQFLWQSATKPFKVGLTYLQSANTTQVLATINVTHTDANGNTASSTLVPIVDPYQQVQNAVALRGSYTVDGFTTLTISDVSANATLKIYMFPSEKIDMRRAVAGMGASLPYSAPRVSNQQKITISPATAAALGS